MSNDVPTEQTPWNSTSPVPNVNLPWWMPQTTPLTADEWDQRVRTVILFCFFGCGGIILNALPILITFCTSMRKNNVHVMVGSLSTADFLFSVSFVFGQTQYILYREEIDFTGCRWLAWFTFTTAFFEFIFPPMLSVNRFISLYHNEKYKRIYTTRHVALMVVGSWIFCTFIPFIFIFNGLSGFDDDNLHCCIVVKYSHWAWTLFYWLIIIIPLVSFCDGTMMYCNYKIYKKLSDHISLETLKQNVVKQNRELFYFLVADMTFPILFHTTYHVAKFVSANRTSLAARRVFTCLYLLNSCVRGVITLSMLRPYRKAIVGIFCFWKRKVTVSPASAACPSHVSNRNGGVAAVAPNEGNDYLWS